MDSVLNIGDKVVHRSFAGDSVDFFDGKATLRGIPMIVLDLDEDKAFCQYYCHNTFKFIELWFYKTALRKI